MEAVGQGKTYIGIDPGTHTGFAIVKGGELCVVATVSIHQAILKIVHLTTLTPITEVIIEDARQIGASKYMAAARAQGAGSVKRDCSIWEDFLTDQHIPFRLIRPAKNSLRKQSDAWFKAQTGWKERTSNHSRDAACLIFDKIIKR